MNRRRPYRSFVSYIDRSREYYAAQGYSQPYTWAHPGRSLHSPSRSRSPNAGWAGDDRGREE